MQAGRPTFRLTHQQLQLQHGLHLPSPLSVCNDCTCMRDYKLCPAAVTHAHGHGWNLASHLQDLPRLFSLVLQLLFLCLPVVLTQPLPGLPRSQPKDRERWQVIVTGLMPDVHQDPGDACEPEMPQVPCLQLWLCKQGATHSPANAARLFTDEATLPFCAESVMPLTRRIMHRAYCSLIMDSWGPGAG